jgi:hypothetical protein
MELIFLNLLAGLAESKNVFLGSEKTDFVAKSLNNSNIVFTDLVDDQTKLGDQLITHFGWNSGLKHQVEVIFICPSSNQIYNLLMLLPPMSKLTVISLDSLAFDNFDGYSTIHSKNLILEFKCA